MKRNEKKVEENKMDRKCSPRENSTDSRRSDYQELKDML